MMIFSRLIASLARIHDTLITHRKVRAVITWLSRPWTQHLICLILGGLVAVSLGCGVFIPGHPAYAAARPGDSRDRWSTPRQGLCRQHGPIMEGGGASAHPPGVPPVKRQGIQADFPTPLISVRCNSPWERPGPLWQGDTLGAPFPEDATGP